MGALRRIASAAGVVRGDGRDPLRLAVVSVAVTWLPLVLIALIDWASTGRLDPLVTDPSVHTRFLVALPLFFLAEEMFGERAERCIERFAADEFTAEGAAAVLGRARAAVAVCDAGITELIMVSLALIGSQLVMWEFGGALWNAWTHAPGHPASVPRLWYAAAALPAYQFLLYRWVWRWLVWALLLWRLSRLHLRPIVTHPDRCAGLSFLSEPLVGFCPVVLGFSAVYAAALASQVLGGTPVKTFVPTFALLLAIALLVTLGPLFVFALPLARARLLGRRQYHDLAVGYTRAFHAKWIDGQPAEPLLGTPDLQSLADLGGAFDVVREMRILPFGRRELAIVLLSVLLPILPLALTEVSLLQLAARLGRIGLGAL